jgi:hypothetical protein
MNCRHKCGVTFGQPAAQYERKLCEDNGDATKERVGDNRAEQNGSVWRA